MAKVICTDLDGTLFFPKRRFTMINSKNRKFLTRFVNDGGRLVIVSSRSPYFVPRVSKNLGFKVDGVGCNGAFVMVNGEIVKENRFEPNRFRDFISEIRKMFDPGLLLITTRDFPVVCTKSHVAKWIKLFYMIYELSEGVYREAPVTSDQIFYEEIERGHVYKLMIFVGITKKKKKLSLEWTKILEEKFPEYEFAWLSQFIEVTPKGTSKASGLTFYLDYNKISKDNVLVVGDSGNDIPLFEEFHENSYCMSHSPKWIREKASHVIHKVADLEETLYPSADSDQKEEHVEKEK